MSALQRLPCLFWLEVVLSLTLLVVGAVGLILKPRPLFTWFPSLMAVASAVACFSALLSLDKGVNFKQRRSTCVYVVSRFGVILLTLSSAVLVVCGFITKETTIAITIPLLVVCVLHIFFGIYVAQVAIRFRKALPVDSRLPNGNGHAHRPPPYATSTLQSQQQRSGDETLASLNRSPVEVPMHVYRPPSGLRSTLDVHFSPDGDKIYSNNNFGGSVQTVYTLASDV